MKSTEHIFASLFIATFQFSVSFGQSDPLKTPKTNTYSLPKPSTCGYNYTAKDTEGWSLVFDDNFDKDLSKWSIWEGGAFNNELQNYKAENLILNNGMLFIHAKKESTVGPTRPNLPTESSFEYTSGRIESRQVFGATDSTSVRIVARLQQPVGEGMWSAFWSYNDPWPTKGEIDIMEYRGESPTKFQSVYHYGAKPSKLQTNADINNFYYQTSPTNKDLATCFYVYELEWHKNRMDIKLDGKLLHSFNEPSNAFVNQFANKPHRVILNLAVGGNFFSNLKPNLIPNNGLMIVDWVKVYQK